MKKIIPNFFVYVVLSLLLIGCSSEHPNKPRATQLFNEINEITKELTQKQLSVQDFTQKLQNIEKSKDKFPSSRNEIENDVNEIISFLENEIKTNRKIVNKYKELSKLGLVKKEADCVGVEIELTEKYIESHEIAIERYKLFIDKEIKDKEILLTKIAPLKKKSDDLDKKVDILRQQQSYPCANKK